MWSNGVYTTKDNAAHNIRVHNLQNIQFTFQSRYRFQLRQRPKMRSMNTALGTLLLIVELVFCLQPPVNPSGFSDGLFLFPYNFITHSQKDGYAQVMTNGTIGAMVNQSNSLTEAISSAQAELDVPGINCSSDYKIQNPGCAAYFDVSISNDDFVLRAGVLGVKLGNDIGYKAFHYLTNSNGTLRELFYRDVDIQAGHHVDIGVSFKPGGLPWVIPNCICPNDDSNFHLSNLVGPENKCICSGTNNIIRDGDASCFTINSPCVLATSFVFDLTSKNGTNLTLPLANSPLMYNNTNATWGVENVDSPVGGINLANFSTVLFANCSAEDSERLLGSDTAYYVGSTNVYANINFRSNNLQMTYQNPM